MATQAIKARRLWRYPLLAGSIVLLLILLLPFLSVAPFQSEIEGALQNSLGRKVSFSKASLTLWSGPVLKLQKVTIEEDPSYGAEPFAFVPVLRGRLRLDKLLSGRLAFSSLSFDQPTLNLVKQEDGTWNVSSLVARFSVPSRLPFSLFPALAITDGRLNFKTAGRKSTLYIADADLSVLSQRSGRAYLRMSGSPARTDRAGTRFGHFRGYGSVDLRPAANGSRVEADVALDRSNLSELTTLFKGSDAGVHGSVSSHFRVAGFLNDLHLAGTIRLEDVHRWDLMPSQGDNWQVRYVGTADLQKQQLDLRTVTSDKATPVVLQLRVNRFLSRASWSVLLALHKTPLTSMLTLARRMGAEMPENLQLDGAVDGVVGYSSSTRLGGGLSIKDVSVVTTDGKSFGAPEVRATLSNDTVYVQRAAFALPNGDIALDASYRLDGQQTSLTFDVDEVPVQTLSDSSGLHSFEFLPPFLRYVRSGVVTGQVKFVSDAQATPDEHWSGKLSVAKAAVALPSLAVPLTSSQFRLAFDGDRFDVDRFSSHIGDTRLSATYRFDPSASIPERVSLKLSRADLSELQGLAFPVLRPSSILARLGVLRRSTPEWMRSLNLQGDIAVEHVNAGDQSVGSLTTQLRWQGTDIRFPHFRLHLPDGVADGAAIVDIRGASPKYIFEGNLSDVAWRGGQVTASGTAQAAGVGSELLRSLQASGNFTGQDVRLSPADNFSKLQGVFDLTLQPGWPNLHLSGITASQDGFDWTGEAASQSDGTLLLDLTREGQQRHIVSSLSPAQSSALSLFVRPVMQVLRQGKAAF